MPRPPRALGLGDIVTGQLFLSPYICRSCRHLALRQRLAGQQPLRHASTEQIGVIEKVRRKFRGTDNASGQSTAFGQADSYEGESFLARRRRERAQEKEAQLLKSLDGERSGRELGSTNEELVPAENWDGLEHVGHKGHWQDIPPGPEDHFEAFAATGHLKASRPEHFLAAIHQATVEIITVQQAGKDLNLSRMTRNIWAPEIKELIARTTIEMRPGKSEPTLTYPTENTKGIILGWLLKMQRMEHQEEARLVSVDPEDVLDPLEQPESLAEDADIVEEFSQSSKGSVDPLEPPKSLAEDADTVEESSQLSNADADLSTTTGPANDQVYDVAAVEQEILAEDEQLFERQRREFEVRQGNDPGSLRKLTEKFVPFYEAVDAPALGAGQPFLDMKLEFRSELTYFLLRRITELTGFHVQDPVLAKAKTLRSIYIYCLEAIKPKPKNLAETLAMRDELASLPNVKIIARRETPVDKEKAVGRWKVIEAELRSRGLPVLGRAET